MCVVVVVVVGGVWLVVVVGKFGLAVFGSGAVAMGCCALRHYQTTSPPDVPFRRRDALELPTRPSLRACVSGMLRELFGKYAAREAVHVLQGRPYSEQLYTTRLTTDDTSGN